MMICATVGWLLWAVPVFAQQIVIWHDKGDDGAKMLQQMAEVFTKEHPGFSIRSISMPTDQWFSRSIAALNTKHGAGHPVQRWLPTGADSTADTQAQRSGTATGRAAA
jgi:ABC-type glycerol-3-phosphate transport system substrate-binding protein